MTNQVAGSARKFHFGWRGLMVFLLTSLGILALIGFSIVHWTERQILTTDNWVKIVAPLPKNNEVATALSSYSVNNLFKGINVEQKVSQVLPPKADFLAPTLTSQLQTTLTKGAKNIIQSDRFETIWIAANRAAHQRLMASARQASPPPAKPMTKFSLNLASLKSSLGSLLGKQGSSLLGDRTAPSSNSGGESIGATIKTSVATFRKYVRAVDFLDGVLGLLSVVLLVGAIVITHSRRRLVLIIGSAILVVGLLQLISVKAVRPDILNQVQTASYRPAVGVVYDQLVASFHKTAMTAVVVGLVLGLLALFARLSYLTRSQTVAHQLEHLQRSRGWQRFQYVRRLARQYRWPIAGGLTLLTLILLAFVLNPSGQGLIRALLLLLLVIEIVNLVAARPRRAPMEQA